MCSCFGNLPCYLSLMFVCFSVKQNQNKEVSKGSTEFPMILKQKHQVSSNIFQLISVSRRWNQSKIPKKCLQAKTCIQLSIGIKNVNYKLTLYSSLMRHYFPEKEYNKVKQTLLQLKTTNSTRTSRDRPLTWRHGNENWRNFRWKRKWVSSKKGNAKIISLILNFWSELLF